MKAIMKYPGSKWSLADWIISFFPGHHSYLEPFAGSLAVLLSKPRSNIETVNDMDDNVVNLFYQIRKDPERLAREIYLTPYAREVYEMAFRSESEDSFKRAVNFYIQLNMGHGFRTTGEKTGWKNDIQGRERAYAAKDWCRLPELIMQVAERLRGVQIDNRPAVDLIRRFNSPKVLIYADPPYMLGTRHGKQYRFEMDDDAHEELLQVLLSHTGKVIISGYDNPLYRDRLKHWHREEHDSRTQTAALKKEIAWMNFEPETQLTFITERRIYGEINSKRI